MRKLIFFLVAFGCNHLFAQNIYISESTEITFFSEAPLENIAAVNKASQSIITLYNDSIVFMVPISGFTFKKALMQEHFNENYLESDKKGFENAILKGKINEKPDFKKDGEYKVTCTGNLLIHGVEQTRTFEGIFTVKEGKISLKSQFTVKVKEHHIKIPNTVIKNIAEEVLVTITANYKPYSKP